MAKIYITRHGETEWNKAKKFQGHLDSKLTDKGRTQAMWLRDHLVDTHFDAVYASPSSRAYDTAVIVTGDRDLPVQKVDKLMEINMGIMEAKTYEEVETNHNKLFHDFWKNPQTYEPEGGETYHELTERAVASIEEIAAKHRGQNVLVVTHGGTLKAIITHYENIPLKDLWGPPFMYNTCLNVLNYESDKGAMEVMGNIDHYPEAEKPHQW